MGPGLPRISASIWSRIAANPQPVALSFLIVILIPLMVFLTAVTMGVGGFVGFSLLYLGISLLNYLMG